MTRHGGWAVAVLVAAFGMPVRASGPDLKSEEEKVAADLANPLAPVTTLSGQYRAEFGNGPDHDVNGQLRLQPSFFKPFLDHSAFLLRTLVPALFRNWPTDDSGLGDLTLVPYFVPDITKQTFLGYGAAVGLPVATEDALGSGKWTAGPAGILARTGTPVTWGGLVQHLGSFAGDGARDDVNVSTVQPFFTYLLGGGWAASINAESAYNWNAEAERWTVPLAASLSKVVHLGGAYVNLGAAAVAYVEKPDSAPDWELRWNVVYVFR